MRPLLNRFFAYYRPHRGLFVLDFSCAVASGLLELGFPIAVKLFIDTLLPTGQWGLIAVSSALLLVIYVLNAGLMATVTYWGHMLGINIETEMRRKAFDHLQKLSFGFFDNQKTGHLVARLTKDLEEIGEVAHHGPEDLFIALMTLVGAFALMFTVNVQLAVITALVVPLTAWLTTRYGGRMTRNWQALYGRVGDFNARIEENVGGIRVVQAFANEDHERRLFAADNQSYRKTKLEAYRIMAASTSLSYLSMRLIQMVVMVAGSYLVLKGELSAGGFVGFLLLVGVFFRPIEKINSVIETYPKGIAGFRRYLTFLDTRPDIADRPGAKDVRKLRGDIEYRNVRFGYAPGRDVLNGLDLTIRAGETVAFVGPSGAGKTTICSLLPRFYEVDSGAITIDGIDIRDMTLRSLRNQIGIVQQDVFLFAGTIRENIAYGRLDATRGRDPGCRPQGTAGPGDRLPAGRARHRHRRARRQALGRPEAAPRDRAHLPQEPADPHPRRGHLGPRYGNGKGDPAGFGRTVEGPHDARDRPSPRHHRQRRPDRRHRSRRHRRAGHAR